MGSPNEGLFALRAPGAPEQLQVPHDGADRPPQPVLPGHHPLRLADTQAVPVYKVMSRPPGPVALLVHQADGPGTSLSQRRGRPRPRSCSRAQCRPGSAVPASRSQPAEVITRASWPRARRAWPPSCRCSAIRRSCCHPQPRLRLTELPQLTEPRLPTCARSRPCVFDRTARTDRICGQIWVLSVPEVLSAPIGLSVAGTGARRRPGSADRHPAYPARRPSPP